MLEISANTFWWIINLLVINIITMVFIALRSEDLKEAIFRFIFVNIFTLPCLYLINKYIHKT